MPMRSISIFGNQKVFERIEMRDHSHIISNLVV